MSTMRIILATLCVSVLGCSAKPNPATVAPVAARAPASSREYLRALREIRSVAGLRFAPYTNIDAATADDRGVRYSIKTGGAARCKFEDTPNPVVVSEGNVMFRSIGSPAWAVHLQCNQGILSVGGTEDAANRFAALWRTMVAGPADSPEQRAAFETAVAAYRADPASFVLPESARALKVQAETAVRDKRLWDAADRFIQALDISPAWPAGHYNLALVYGELEVPTMAIAEMTKYLTLAPDAENARAAQDKIYVWEDKAKR